MSLAEREDMYDKELLEIKKKVDKLLAHKTPQYKQGYDEAIDDFAEKVIEQLKEYAFDMSLENPDCKAVWLDRAIQIINELSGRTEL